MLAQNLGLHVVEPAEELGPMPGAFGRPCVGCGVGAVLKAGYPHWKLWVPLLSITALTGGTAGYLVAPKKKKLRGVAIGAVGSAFGAAVAVIVINQLPGE